VSTRRPLIDDRRCVVPLGRQHRRRRGVFHALQRLRDDDGLSVDRAHPEGETVNAFFFGVLEAGSQLSDFHIHGALHDDRTGPSVVGRVCCDVASAAGRERRGEHRHHRRQHVEPCDHAQQLSGMGTRGW
jgi:hypothetical protein